MASEIRVNQIQNRSGLTTTTFTDTGVDIVGVATAFNFKTGTTNVHNVGVEAAGINVLGADTPIGTGATIYDDGGARFSGIVTATSFVGSGANLTGIPALTGSTNNTLVTVTGSNAIAGEANLTYDAGYLFLGGTGSSADGTKLKLKYSNNNDTDVISTIVFGNNVAEVSKIKGETRNGNTNGMITFHSTISGSESERMRVNHDGAFCFGNDSARPAEFSQPDGFSIRWDDKGQFQNSVTSTTCGLLNRKGTDGDILSFRKAGTGVGHIGVNASTMYLNFNASSVAANQLDDYEQGDLTLTLVGTSGGSASYGYRTGHYTKIGNICHVTGDIRFNGAWSGSTGSR